MTNAIYEAKGKAREYSELACNLYDGCAHGCLYCYAPDVLHKSKEDFHADPQPRIGILDALEKDARAQQKKGDKRPVLFSFTCDPYQPIDKKHQLTRQAIEILHKYAIPVMILTKGGKRAMRDFDLLQDGDMFGATLTFTEQYGDQSLHWEPRAALPFERIHMLWEAHEAGIKTWVSLEPVIDPKQSIELIRVTNGFVDHFKVGRWNHSKEADKINWRNFAYEARAVLNRYRCDYYIKKDLAREFVS
jgi:DNA repair photolyase